MEKRENRKNPEARERHQTDSEVLLNEVGEMAYIGGWELDVRTKAVHLTKETYRIFDISEDEKFDLSKAVLFFDPPNRSTLEAALQRCMETGEPFDLELPFTSAKGRHLWTRAIGRSVSAGGEVVKLEGAFQDITERKEAKVALRESEDRYQNLYQSSHDAIMTLEPPSWSFTTGNPATVQMFMARDEAEFTSKEPWALSPERQPDGRDSGEKAREMIETAMRNGTHSFEWTHRRLNGEDFPATVLLSRVELAGKVFLQATVRDITEQKRADILAKERMKELQAFYGLAGITERKGITLDQLYQEFVNLLPNSWRYTEIAYSRIVIGDREFCTNNFTESAWKQTAPVRVQGSVVGKIEVGYLEERPELDEGPFLKEERILIDALAERLGRIIERVRTEEMLRTFSLAVDESSDAIGMSTPEGKHYYQNTAFNDLFGNVGEDPPARLYINKQVGREVFDTIMAGDPWIGEVKMWGRDGKVLDILLRAYPVKDKAGKVIVLIGVHTDITERKREEEALILSEQKFHSYVDNSPVAIFVADGAGQYTDVNRASCNLLGYSREEMLSMNVLDLAPLEERQQTLDQFISIKEKIKTESAVSLEMSLKKKDGSACPVILSVVKLPSDAIMGFAVDITERKRIEESLQDSEERFRTMMNWTYDWEYWIAPDRDVVYCSPSIQHITGYSAEEFIADKGLIDRIIHPDDHPLWEGHIPLHTSNQEERKPLEVDFRIIAKDGSLRWIHHTCRAIFADDGRWIGRRISNRDITEQKQAEKVMWESEERYRSLAESITDNIFIIDRDDTIRFVNTHAAETLHLPADEVIGKPRKKFFPPDLADHQGMILQKAFETGEPSRNEERVVFGNQEFWQDNVLIPLKDETGNVTSVIGVSRDITERKRVEEALRGSRQILEEIINTVPARVFWKDKNLTYLGCNTQFARDAGFEKPEDIIGKDDYAMGWGKQAELYRADDRLVIDSGRPRLLFEEPQTTPTGEQISLLTSKVPLKDPTGEIIGVLGTYLDITERRRAEEALRESNEYLRMLIDFANAPIIVWDPAFRITRFNHAFESLAGRVEHEVIKQPLDILFPDESRDDSLILIKKTLNGEHWETVEIPILTKEGSVRTVLWNSANIRDHEGRIISTIAQGVDITERKRAEAELERLNQSLEETIRNRTQALTESERKYHTLFDKTKDAYLIIENNKFVDCNAATLEMLGYKTREELFQAHPSSLSPPTQPDGRSSFEKAEEMMAIALRDGSHRFEWVHRKANGEDFWVEVSLTAIPIQDHQIIHTAWRDITDRKKAEAAIQESLKEKEGLLKEIHHRVRNNLQVVSSIISLQAKSVSDPATFQQIRAIRMRIGTLALVHEIAYLAKTPESINMRDFLYRCSSKVIDEFGCEPGRITITITAENVQVALSQAVPCSLIVNELLMNSVRHAFPGNRHGEIRIGFAIAKGNYVLEYGDDGIGFPEGMHPDKAETGGLSLIQGLARQIRGTVESTTRPGTGCTLTFPAEKREE